MLPVISFVRYSNASLRVDSYFIFGVVVFFLLCGILIFQNQIWEEEDYLKNKKWINWKSEAIKSNKSDLSKIYPRPKNNAKRI